MSITLDIEAPTACKLKERMSTLIYLMPKRKAVTYRIDERLKEMIEKVARRDNISANRTIENLILAYLRDVGMIDESFEPLGETRGGSRKSQSKNEEEPA